MRNMLILLAVAVLATSSTGCSRCRGLFRRGAPCGGTALTAAPMLGGAIPLGNPVAVRPAPQLVQPTIIAQPNCGCQQTVPMCCEPCPTECVPCDSNCGSVSSGYIGQDCGCENIAPGEYFGGYLEGSVPPASSGMVAPQGSGTFPEPSN